MEFKKNGISNSDIKSYYIFHCDSQDDSWMRDLFKKVSFFAISRIEQYTKNLQYQDLKQEAMIGLWIAIKTFDHHKNFDFYRWAQWNISKAVRNFLNNESIIFNHEARNCLETFKHNQEDVVFIKEIFYQQSELVTSERDVLYHRLILNKTLNEVGFELKLSNERIRQIQKQALNKIRNLC